MFGVFAAIALMAMIMVIIPLRFVRATRRAYRDPQFRGLFFLVIATFTAGTLFYSYVEGWSLLDSLYFSVMTLATVGYGDLAPATDAGKVFTIFYVLAGVGIIVAFVDAVARESVAQRLHAGRSRNAKEDEE